jgi:hypothetical protein
MLTIERRFRRLEKHERNQGAVILSASMSAPVLQNLAFTHIFLASENVGMIEWE